jgi:hypothetical protein
MGIIDQENNNVVTEENNYQNQFTTVIEISICQTYDDQCHSHTYGKVSMSHLWIIQYVTPIKKRSQYITPTEKSIRHIYGKLYMSHLWKSQYVILTEWSICQIYGEFNMSHLYISQNVIHVVK